MWKSVSDLLAWKCSVDNNKSFSNACVAVCLLGDPWLVHYFHSNCALGVVTSHREGDSTDSCTTAMTSSDPTATSSATSSSSSSALQSQQLQQSGVAAASTESAAARMAKLGEKRDLIVWVHLSHAQLKLYLNFVTGSKVQEVGLSHTCVRQHTPACTHIHTHTLCTCTCTCSLPKLVTWVSPGEGRETQKESWKDNSIGH